MLTILFALLFALSAQFYAPVAATSPKVGTPVATSLETGDAPISAGPNASGSPVADARNNSPPDESTCPEVDYPQSCDYDEIFVHYSSSAFPFIATLDSLDFTSYHLGKLSPCYKRLFTDTTMSLQKLLPEQEQYKQYKAMVQAGDAVDVDVYRVAPSKARHYVPVDVDGVVQPRKVMHLDYDPHTDVEYVSQYWYEPVLPAGWNGSVDQAGAEKESAADPDASDSDSSKPSSATDPESKLSSPDNESAARTGASGDSEHADPKLGWFAFNPVIVPVVYSSDACPEFTKMTSMQLSQFIVNHSDDALFRTLPDPHMDGGANPIPIADLAEARHPAAIPSPNLASGVQFVPVDLDNNYDLFKCVNMNIDGAGREYPSSFYYQPVQTKLGALHTRFKQLWGANPESGMPQGSAQPYTPQEMPGHLQQQINFLTPPAPVYQVDAQKFNSGAQSEADRAVGVAEQPARVPPPDRRTPVGMQQPPVMPNPGMGVAQPWNGVPPVPYSVQTLPIPGYGIPPGPVHPSFGNGGLGFGVPTAWYSPYAGVPGPGYGVQPAPAPIAFPQNAALSGSRLSASAAEFRPASRPMSGGGVVGPVPYFDTGMYCPHPDSTGPDFRMPFGQFRDGMHRNNRDRMHHNGRDGSRLGYPVSNRHRHQRGPNPRPNGRYHPN